MPVSRQFLLFNPRLNLAFVVAPEITRQRLISAFTPTLILLLKTHREDLSGI